MWSLTVLHRHAVNGDYRVTERYWVECESQVPAGGVDRLCEASESKLKKFYKEVFSSYRSCLLAASIIAG